MNDELQGKVGEILTTLAGKLGIGVEVLWESLKAQGAISSVVDVLWIVAMIVAAFYLRKWWRWALVKDKYGEFDSDRIAPATIASGIYSILVFATFMGLPLTVAGFTNPNYWALRHVLKMLAR